MNKCEELFRSNKPQLVKDFLDEVREYTVIYAYEIQENIMSGTHIEKNFLRNHLDLFEDTGYWHVVDDELYEHSDGCERIYQIIGFVLIIKENKLEEFKKYSLAERLS